MADENINIQESKFTKELLRYFSFWPWYLISLIVMIILSYSYLRYAKFNYNTSSIIQIIDDVGDTTIPGLN